MTIQGIILIVLFVVIFLVALNADKNTSKKFKEKISGEYPVKDQCGKMYITESGDIIFEYVSGTLIGYKKWNIKDITYIYTEDNSFSFLGADKKALAGEYLTPSKKPLVIAKNAKLFEAGIAVDEYVKFVKKHASHIEEVEG